MSKFCLFNIVLIITICFEFVYLLIIYLLFMSDIRILINAKNLDSLDKWAIKYVKKNNFNKDVILQKINKAVRFSEKAKRIGRWGLLLETMVVIIYFISRGTDFFHFGDKEIFIGHDSVTILDSLMIFFLISVLWAVYFFNLIHKRNIVAHEQFTRLFKEENNSPKNYS